MGVQVQPCCCGKKIIYRSFGFRREKWLGDSQGFRQKWLSSNPFDAAQARGCDVDLKNNHLYVVNHKFGQVQRLSTKTGNLQQTLLTRPPASSQNYSQFLRCYPDRELILYTEYERNAASPSQPARLVLLDYGGTVQAEIGEFNTNPFYPSPFVSVPRPLNGAINLATDEVVFTRSVVNSGGAGYTHRETLRKANLDGSGETELYDFGDQTITDSQINTLGDVDYKRQRYIIHERANDISGSDTEACNIFYTDWNGSGMTLLLDGSSLLSHFQEPPDPDESRIYIISLQVCEDDRYRFIALSNSDIASGREVVCFSMKWDGTDLREEFRGDDMPTAPTVTSILLADGYNDRRGRDPVNVDA